MKFFQSRGGTHSDGNRSASVLFHKRFWRNASLLTGLLGLSSLACAQYYYPQQQGYYQYPPGYGYGYPQQQQQQPRQRQQSQPQQNSASKAASQPSAPARPARTQRDNSGDAPPSADVAALSQGPLTVYIWDDRDSLADLARAAGVSNSQILALNNLAASQLRSGQVLRVPPLASTTSSLKIARGAVDQRAREIWRGVRGKKQIALTFDAGGTKEALDVLLKNLQEKDAAATFFATGEWANKYQDSIKLIHDAGYRVFNHSWSHPEFTKISDEAIREQLTRADAAIEKVTGVGTKPYFRPPFGDRDRRVLRTAAEAGYQSIYWTHDSLDSVGDKKSATFVADRVLNPPKHRANPDAFLDGAIVLMHVGETGTAEAVPEIIDTLRQRGFTLVTVEEILKP